MTLGNDMVDIPTAYDFSGRSFLITGGGTGIGRATALLVARQGARVTLASRKTDALESVAEEVRAIGAEALVLTTDVLDPDAITNMIDSHVSHFGGCDVLVNNSGGSYMFPLDQWDLPNWQRMIDLNLRAVWLASRQMAPIMIEAGGGSIVNVSSGAAVGVLPEVAPYAVAKLGVEHMTRLFAAAWGKDGIRVNCVRVGAVKSEGYLRSMSRSGRDPDEAGGRNAVGRAGWPIEVAHGIAYLSGYGSGFTTGVVLPIDGGPMTVLDERPE